MEDLRDLEHLARLGFASPVDTPLLLARLRLMVHDDEHLLHAWERLARCPLETELDRRRFFHASRAFIAGCKAARPELASVTLRKSVPPIAIERESA